MRLPLAALPTLKGSDARIIVSFVLLALAAFSVGLTARSIGWGLSAGFGLFGIFYAVWAAVARMGEGD